MKTQTVYIGCEVVDSANLLSLCIKQLHTLVTFVCCQRVQLWTVRLCNKTWRPWKTWWKMWSRCFTLECVSENSIRRKWIRIRPLRCRWFWALHTVSWRCRRHVCHWCCSRTTTTCCQSPSVSRAWRYVRLSPSTMSWPSQHRNHYIVACHRYTGLWCDHCYVWCSELGSLLLCTNCVSSPINVDIDCSVTFCFVIVMIYVQTQG